jgi:hypothetical protein
MIVWGGRNTDISISYSFISTFKWVYFNCFFSKLAGKKRIDVFSFKSIS